MEDKNHIVASFQPRTYILPIVSITPVRDIPESLRTSQKYRQIAASIEHVGLVEPLVVYPAGADQYWLLDGHVRLDILKAKGVMEIRCLLATDDEAYTYNKRVNSLPPIAEHFMILKAIKHGVSEQRIALALNVDVAQIRKKRNLLDGICQEAVDLLNDRRITGNVFVALRKMKPIRQIEAAELMIASGVYTARYAKLLLMSTSSDLLVDSNYRMKNNGISPSQKAVMEQESVNLLRDLKAAEESYGHDILTLSVSSKYIQALLGRPKIMQYLNKYHPDLLHELQALLLEVNSDRPEASQKIRPAPVRSSQEKRSA